MDMNTDIAYCRRRNCSSSSVSSSPLVRKLKQKFPDKLWSVVSDENEDSCIWNSTGTSLLINKGKFTQRFLSNSRGLFRTSKFKSFVRQLNLYGFRKVNKMRRRDHEIWWEYQNENFIRDCPNLLKLIKRKANPDELSDCDGCTKLKIHKRKMKPASTALDLRLALFDGDDCSSENECQIHQQIHPEIIDIDAMEHPKDKQVVTLSDLDINFSQSQSPPPINIEPFVINIPLSQRQMWENNDNYLSLSLFPDLPSSQDVDLLSGSNCESNDITSNKSQFSFSF